MSKQSPSDFPIHKAAEILRRVSSQWTIPIITQMGQDKRRAPFRVLISTLLSLRTKDACTAEASKRLFARARSPRGMLRLGAETIAELVYPVGFYKTKSVTIVDVCQRLIDDFDGQVPDSLEVLVSLKGVGRKTANLVLTQGFGIEAICVDTHVHRITNRWGYVRTKTPDETEMVLREILPRHYWIEINDWLVSYGQNLCAPVSPWCGRCEMRPFCARNGVGKSR